MQPDPSPGDESLRAVKQAIRKQQWATAEEYIAGAAADGLPWSALGRAFAAVDQTELFVRLLWKYRDDLFNDVGAVALFARTVSQAGLGNRYFDELRQWALGRESRQARFGPTDSLIRYRNLDERVLAALFLVKFGSWDLNSPDNAFQQAARHADSFEVARETTDLFYRHRRDPEVQFPAWLREFKIAQVLHHLSGDSVVVKGFRRDPDPVLREKAAQFLRIADLQRHLDTDSARRIFEGIERSRGLLLSTYHGGFVRISNFFYTNFMPDPYWLTAKGQEQPNVFIVEGNERATAFRTFKALSQGKSVLIAPDGSHFGDSSAATIEVLGLKTKISAGGAFLAYETKCDTGWISAVRQGDVFVPEYIAGPRRLEGETYPSFRDRWLSFYVERLQYALSSGPENLVLTPRWSAPYSEIWN